MTEVPKLRSSEVKGRIKLLYALPYHGQMVYVRRIDQEVFMYDVVYKNQIYSSYVIMKPKKGKKNLTANEVNQTLQMVLAGAFTTVEQLLGIKMNEKEQKVAERFIDATKNITTVN